MNTRPIRLTTNALAPVARLHQCGAAPRRAGRIVEWADQARLAVDEAERLALVEGMIAQRHRIGAGVEKLLKDRLVDAKSTGRVLAVDHHEIEPPHFPQRGEPLADDGAARAPDHVAHEQ